MTPTSLKFIRLRILVSAVVLAGCFSVVLPPAAAQTTTGSDTPEQLRALIAQLQETLLILQRKQYEHVHQKETNVIHGNSYVKATRQVSLSTIPGGTRVLGKEPKGSGGEVTAGPRLIAGVVWWKIDFEAGNEGWVREKYLERVPSIVLSQDTDGDGVKDQSIRVLGDYQADRIILFPKREGVSLVSIPEDLQMMEAFDRAYRTGQLSDVVDGPVEILQSDPYLANQPFIKRQDASVPIAWTATNVPANAEVEIEVEALRLLGGSLSGGVWSAKSLPGDTVGVYYYNIKDVGTIGAGDYRSQVRIKECTNGNCKVTAKSPYRYFSIRYSHD